MKRAAPWDEQVGVISSDDSSSPDTEMESVNERDRKQSDDEGSDGRKTQAVLKDKNEQFQLLILCHYIWLSDQKQRDKKIFHHSSQRNTTTNSPRIQVRVQELGLDSCILQDRRPLNCCTGVGTNFCLRRLLLQASIFKEQRNNTGRYVQSSYWSLVLLKLVNRSTLKLCFEAKGRDVSGLQEADPNPINRGSVIPFTSWAGLGKSIKQLYRQPLHYLTNLLLKQWDQLRIGGEDEYRPLDTIIHPRKAEATIWLVEEVHRHTSSHHHVANLWFSDPMHHASIDAIYPLLRSKS